MPFEPPPRLDGKRAIVTGGTSGVGFETARALAGLGATVTIASRDPAKGEAALNRLREAGLRAEFRALDVGALASVRAFAAATDKVDLLVCNAGLMGVPRRELTPEGFERHLGVNYLGHFALTGLLLPLLCADGHGRVVTVSSVAHRRERLDWSDLQAANGYGWLRAYSRSKLAILMFGLELDRRARAHGWPITSVCAHPGWARTDLIRPAGARGPARVGFELLRVGFGWAAQSAADGARPIVAAAASADVAGGAYLGPDGSGERRGAPAPAVVSDAARDPEAGRRLWAMSERLTGVTFMPEPGGVPGRTGVPGGTGASEGAGAPGGAGTAA